jgi:hypothetical protein
MNEVTLTQEDEGVREACERQANEFWPGARVLVHPVGEQYRAAVFLPEDGVDPDASAEQSELHASPRAALQEVLAALKQQQAPLAD